VLGWHCVGLTFLFAVEGDVVDEKTKLVDLCNGDYEDLAACFTLPGGKTMLVKHLKGKDEAGWEAFVKGEGGPHGLVSGWLEENNLWRFLRGNEASKDTSFPAPVAPSSVREEELRPKFCMSSVVARSEFVELLGVLKEPCGETQAVKDAKELVSILNRLRGQDKERTVQVSGHELFTNDSGCAKIELAYSSVVSDFFSRRLGQLRSFHQMPARKGTSDVLLCHGGAVAGEYHPVCVIECGMQGKSDVDMRKSLRGYAVNYCPIVPVGTYFLGVEWLNVDSALRARLRVKAFYRVPNDARVHEVMLWSQEEGMELDEMLARVMCAVRLADEHNFGAAGGKHWRVLSRNVAVDLRRELVFKSFDYRDRWDQIPEGYRRHAEASCQWLPGCQIVARQADFVLLRYPFLKGASVAKKASEFVPLFEELAKLHEQDVVHGDVRAYNMIFVEGCGGKLIDFDYSGKHGTRPYPPGYWRDLEDTKRHVRAVAGQPMRKEHDCFSLGAVMAMYRCDHAGWAQLVEKLQSSKPDVGALCGELQELVDSALQWCGVKMVNAGTNSVPQKHQTSSPTKEEGGRERENAEN